MKLFAKSTLCFSIGLALAGITGSASASFFQLAENNASGIGNAFAGGSAIAEDASTVWYNPAGLTRLQGAQFVAAGHFIKPSFEFHKESARTVLGGNISGGEGGNAGEDKIVPNLYFSQPLNEKMTLGVGINSPFGLATDYDSDWVGRYHALRSEIQSVNLNVGLGYKINDQFSIGGGVNYQKLDATLSQAIDFATICTTAAGGAFSAACGAGAGFNSSNPNDGKAEVKADDDAFGFNLGFLWQLSDTTRVGTAYRSKMKYTLKGNAEFDRPSNIPGALVTAGGFSNTDVTADTTLPATLSVSGFHQLTPQWALMGDITRTFWSKLPELNIDFANAQPNSVVTLNLKDVNRYSVGANYAPGGNWVYRAGIALDKTPTPSADVRTPRLPDGDRTWLAVGAKYAVSNKFNLDMGFVHILVDDPKIDKAATGENQLRGSLVGTYEGSINVLSVQGTWSF
jgi:long-chain fatty acid transport protein